jgi:hypothetical protein
MFESLNPVILILLITSSLTIGLILNQNESIKDSPSNQNSSSSTNPLETLTWICLLVQLFLLIIKIKINES